MAEVGTRCRLVTDQDGERHISSVVLAPGEADGMLDTEAYAHSLAGWSVVRFDRGIVCVRGGKTRRVWVKDYDPMGDATSSSEAEVTGH